MTLGALLVLSSGRLSFRSGCLDDASWNHPTFGRFDRLTIPTRKRAFGDNVTAGCRQDFIATGSRRNVQSPVQRENLEAVTVGGVTDGGLGTEVTWRVAGVAPLHHAIGDRQPLLFLQSFWETGG